MSNDIDMVSAAVAQGWPGHSSVIVVRNKYLRADAWEKLVERTCHRLAMVDRSTWTVTLATLSRPWIKIKTLEDDPDTIRGIKCLVWLAPSCTWAAGVKENERLERWREFQKVYGMPPL